MVPTAHTTAGTWDTRFAGVLEAPVEPLAHSAPPASCVGNVASMCNHLW